MAVDLGDLIDSIRAELSAPGENFFPNAVDDDWLQRLQNGFWSARLMGFFANYREVDGVVVPLSGAVDLPREQQQLVVFFAAYTAVKAKMLSMAVMTRSKAGPVESEVQRSAQVLQALLKDLQARLDQLVKYVLRPNRTAVAFFDALVLRDQQLFAGQSLWGGGYADTTMGGWWER